MDDRFHYVSYRPALARTGQHRIDWQEGGQGLRLHAQAEDSAARSEDAGAHRENTDGEGHDADEDEREGAEHGAPWPLAPAR